MLIGNSGTCEACVKQDVCKYVSTRKAVLDKLENCLSDVNITETPFVVSLSCNSFSNNRIERRGV